MRGFTQVICKYYAILYETVAEHKFVCPTHSETKQTETSECGAEKGLLQG